MASCAFIVCCHLLIATIAAQDYIPGSDVHFVLFAQSNRLDVTARTIQYVDPNLPTVMLIHGWIASINMEIHLLNMTRHYRALNDRNVIFVDWSRDSREDYFTEVYSRVGIIGNVVGQMIMNLIEHGVDVKRIHLCGQSLGAHICGYAGRYVRQHHPQNTTIGRITGIDPAGPLYGRPFGVLDNQLSLGATDADIVDVTHGDGEFFGITDAIGTIDFYLNGGLTQPVCTVFLNYQFFRQSLMNICSHIFPTALFELTINSTAYHASSDPHLCENLVVYGDMFNGNATGIYYINTTTEYPYRSSC